MVRIRMARLGRPHRPFYRINAVDSHVKRDGLVIETLGWYDPMSPDPAKSLSLNHERVKYWISKGAQPSETVRDFLAKNNLVDVESHKADRAKRTEAKKKGAEKRAALAVANTAATAAAAAKKEAAKKAG